MHIAVVVVESYEPADRIRPAVRNPQFLKEARHLAEVERQLLVAKIGTIRCTQGGAAKLHILVSVVAYIRGNRGDRYISRGTVVAAQRRLILSVVATRLVLDADIRIARIVRRVRIGE